MTDYLDTLTKAGEVPPPSDETLARAQTAVRNAAAAAPARPRQRVPMVAVGAAAGVAAVALVGALVFGPQHAASPLPADGPAASPTISYRGLGPLVSCAVTPEGANLRKQAFAFDGTVLTMEEPAPGHSLGVRQNFSLVTFKVNHWYKAGSAAQIQVLMPGPEDPRPPYGQPEYGLAFKVGSRLLVSGQVLDGVPADLVNREGSACGFSRFYGDAVAREWAKTFGK